MSNKYRTPEGTCRAGKKIFLIWDPDFAILGSRDNFVTSMYFPVSLASWKTITMEQFIEFYFELGLKYRDTKSLLDRRHRFRMSE